MIKNHASFPKVKAQVEAEKKWYEFYSTLTSTSAYL